VGIKKFAPRCLCPFNGGGVGFIYSLSLMGHLASSMANDLCAETNNARCCIFPCTWCANLSFCCS